MALAAFLPVLLFTPAQADPAQSNTGLGEDLMWFGVPNTVNPDPCSQDGKVNLAMHYVGGGLGWQTDGMTWDERERTFFFGGPTGTLADGYHIIVGGSDVSSATFHMCGKARGTCLGVEGYDGQGRLHLYGMSGGFKEYDIFNLSWPKAPGFPTAGATWHMTGRYRKYNGQHPNRTQVGTGTVVIDMVTLGGSGSHYLCAPPPFSSGSSNTWSYSNTRYNIQLIDD